MRLLHVVGAGLLVVGFFGALGTSPVRPSAAQPAVTSTDSARYFDLRSYGAKCDGVADDTSAFTAAIGAAAALNGGILSIPPSVQPCQITQLSINSSYLTLQGAGMTDDNVSAVGPSRIRCTAASG